MKKKSLLFGAGLLLTGVIAFSSCGADDVIDAVTAETCYTCTHATEASKDICDEFGSVTNYSAAVTDGFTCTLN